MQKSKNKVIFLDRDGVLCVEKGYVTSVEELIIFDYSAKAVALLKELGYRVVTITNQSAIARGLLSVDELERIHAHLMNETKIDSIYYCPHLPVKSGMAASLVEECNCRKPNVGLIKKAVDDLSLTLEGAYFVGDRASDIETGKNIGITTVLLESGYGSKKLEYDIVPDLVFKNLLEFAEYISAKEKYDV